jgi:hypothetical protein
MRATATLLATLAMALTAIGLAFADPGERPEEVRAELAAASGAVRITNSREGQAVFAAGSMRPGEGVSGRVRIGNGGDVAGRFAVRPAGVSDTPGPYGGRLSERVELVLFDVTDVHTPVTVYAGRPSQLGEIELGTIVAGGHRDYLVAMTLPEGSGDNLYQGSAVSLGFEWRAAALPAATTPTPTPTPTPVTPAPVTPAPVTPAPVTPTAGPTATAAPTADELGLPPARACASRRKFTITLKAPRGLSVVSATIAINGKIKARVKGGRTKAPVDLRGLPKGRVKVKVAVKASDGKTYTATRTYRTCATG